jgi:ABC-type oligopeptide transport system substrate-binding subunit
MKRILKTAALACFVVLFASAAFTGCGPKSGTESTEAADSTAQAADSTEHPAEHPEHPSDSTEQQ